MLMLDPSSSGPIVGICEDDDAREGLSPSPSAPTSSSSEDLLILSLNLRLLRGGGPSMSFNKSSSVISQSRCQLG